MMPYEIRYDLGLCSFVTATCVLHSRPTEGKLNLSHLYLIWLGRKKKP